jgi:hypothetical protein
MDWHSFKDWLETASGLDMDALHIHAGILCQLIASLILRRSLRSPVPWLVVLGAVIVNEYYDLTYEYWPNRADQWAESVKDGWNTLLLPTALMLLARFLPNLLTGRSVGRPL